MLLPRERWHFRLLLTFMVFNGMVELAAVGVVPLYVRIITEPTILTKNSFMLECFPNFSNLAFQQILIYGGIVLLLVYIVKLVVNIFNGYFQERFIRGREMRISTDLLKRYLYAPYSFHLQRNSSDLIRNAQVEIQTMNNFFIVPVLKATTQVFITPLIFLSLIFVNPIVSLITMSILVIAIYLYNFWIKKPLLKYRGALQKSRGMQLQSISQALGGIKELKVMQREEQFLKMYRKVMHSKHQAILQTQTINRLNAPYLEFIALMGMLLIAVLVTVSGASSDLIAATLAFYGLSMFRLKQSIGIILDSYTTAKVNHITISPIFDDLTMIMIQDSKIGQTIYFKDSLRLENVEYHYPGTNKGALHNINLTIKKGESIGIIGSTGAGKTTLVDVILGLLIPQRGKVTIDGVNIFENLSGWYRLVGYIPQQIYLLDDSIRSNVAFGLTSDEIDDNAVWQALETAQLATFIRELPEGIDTITGERGIRLSGGQRQRIGIARALYHKPSVLIMDEATAALDNTTEKLFVDALDSISKDHTLIIIAHRLTTIKKCDRILLMDKGIIKDEGKFDQLLGKSTIFQEFEI